MEYKRYELNGIAPRPEWWRVRPDEIQEDCRNVRVGKSRVIAHTPLNLPIYAVTYYDFSPPERKINWSSASGTHHPELYGNGPDAPPTVMVAAGIHGCEVEGVVLLSNLIRLLEVGLDWRGVSRPGLVELASHYRLVLLPCVNMDGRAISPDHRIGADLSECRKAGGGIALNGEPIRWPEMKEHFPLPVDGVRYLGGYPNSEGFNIMHDATPGNFRTSEAAALCRLADECRVDFFLNLHSQPETASCFITAPQMLNYPANIATERVIIRIVTEALKRAGFPSADTSDAPLSNRIDLDTMIALSCGAPVLTLEFPARLSNSFDQILMSGYVVLETILRYGLANGFVDRSTLLT